MTGSIQVELQHYFTNAFDLSGWGPGTDLPLPDEPFVAVWEAWTAEARERGAFAVLREHLPQLRFPIREGISETEAYRAATRKGVPAEDLPEATGLELDDPGKIELRLHPTPAGRIPVVIARGRQEFAALLRALARRNEPAPVPDAQGALMIAGFVNWSRIRELRAAWEALEQRETATWGEEMARITPQKELYQDRFILLSDGPYSAVPAGDLGLDEGAWRETSLALRLDHECAHYFTRRVLGTMRNHVHDELIADYAGMTAATGGFRADWFLRFVGARLEIYRGDLSDAALGALRDLLPQVAENVERLEERSPVGGGLRERGVRLAALAALDLGELAKPFADTAIERAERELRDRPGRRA